MRSEFLGTQRHSGLAGLVPAGDPCLSGRVLTNTVDGTLAWSYTYDGVGRLSRAVGSGHDYQYGYASSGGCGANTGAGLNSNRTSLIDNGVTLATSCYDNADRLTSTTQSGYVGGILYDARGNTTGIAGQTLSYDYADRHTGTTISGTTVTYTRDAADRIVARTDNGVTHRFAYTGAGDSSSYTLTTANIVVDHTISLPGGVTANLAAGVWSYPNIHGDITAAANATGVKQGSTVFYDPFGSMIAGAIPDNQAGSFDNGWVGQHDKRLEHASGLRPTIQMGARPYDPALGRFQELDPIEGGNANDYTYPLDPVNQDDLTGLKRRGGLICDGIQAVSIVPSAPSKSVSGAGSLTYSVIGWVRKGSHSVKAITLGVRLNPIGVLFTILDLLACRGVRFGSGDPINISKQTTSNGTVVYKSSQSPTQPYMNACCVPLAPDEATRQRQIAACPDTPKP